MLLDKYITIKTNPSNYKHYIEKGYLIKKCGEQILIDINDLPVKSHVKIKCKCLICNQITLITYSNYKRQIKNSYYACKKCWNNKLKETIKDKYGVDNIRKLDNINKKVKETNLKKYGVKSLLEKKEIRNLIKKYYGVDNISQLDYIKEIKKNKSLNVYGTNTPLQDKNIINIIRQKHIKNGRWNCDDNYKTYRNRVNYLTKKKKSELLNNWDGLDYYDNQYIKNNFELNKNKNHNNYPSIDHKIPVIYGFMNNIPIEEISSLSNLCVTKRFINSMKSTITEIEFIDMIHGKKLNSYPNFTEN